MLMLKSQLPTWASACAALLLLAGCATPSPPPAVVPPTLDPGPLPLLVEKTPPKPAGHFQRSFLELSSPSYEKPTTSTPPTPPAATIR